MIFLNVKYYLVPSLSDQRILELTTVLDGNGATKATSITEATHVISNSHRFEGWQVVDEGTAIVTDAWVDRAMLLGKIQPVQYYSTDPAMIFSGVTASATELPATDLEVLSAGISALGGLWRSALTKDVTHLFALNSTSEKYATAMHHRAQTHVKVLLPHWFDDAVRLGLGNLPTTEYEWPEPKIFQRPSASGTITEEGVKKQDRTNAEKKLLYRTALWSPEGAIPSESGKNVWQGKKIILSASLELVDSRREAVCAGIERSGGFVIDFESDTPDNGALEEAQKMDEADVLITRWRGGKAYIKAMRASKLIGTLNWLFHVQSTGVLSMPTNQLLHYPIPKKPIEGFQMHEITVTNYTGEARDYLKKLIHAMGATFTPSMSGRNTVLIAAFIQGTKTDKARSWSIPIVNHTWLEDCFVRWRNLTVGLEKYIVFPPGVDFAALLGDRGLGREVELETDELEAEEEEDEQRERAELEEKESKEAGKRAAEEEQARKDRLALRRQVEVVVGTSSRLVPLTAENSARDVREVEEVVADGLIDVDDDFVPINPANDMDVDKITRSPSHSTPKKISTMKSKSSPLKVTSSKKATPLKASPLQTSPRTRSRMASNYSPVIPPRAESSSEDDLDVFARPRRKKLVRRSGQDFDLSFSVPPDTVEVEMPPISKISERSPKKPAAEDSPRSLRRSPRKAAETHNAGESDNDDAAQASRNKGKGKQIIATSDHEMDVDTSNERSSRPRRPRASKDVSRDEAPAKRGMTSSQKSNGRRKFTAEGNSSGMELDVSEKTSKRAPQRSTPESEDDDWADERPARHGPPPKRSPWKGKNKAPPVQSESEEDEVESIVVQRRRPSGGTNLDPQSSPLTPTSPPKASSSKSSDKRPQRMASIIGPGLKLQQIPSPTKIALDSSSDDEETLPKNSPSKGVVRTQSLRAVAAERNRAPISSRLIANGNTKEKGKGKERRYPSPASSTRLELSADDEPPSTARAKRSAATKATQRLHDEVMPDVMNYEQQMRKARKSGGLPDAVGSRTPSTVPNKKKRPSNPESRAGDAGDHGKESKRRKLAVSQAMTTGINKQTENDRTPAKGKQKAKPQPISVESGDDDPKTSRSIKLMTTGVTLEDDIVKPLIKLGIKITTKPSECTHLVVSHLVRTEKFLCALAVAPYVITEEWAKACVAAKKILDEDEYRLQDKEAEKKFNFKLSEALSRAAVSKGQLFAKKIFYVTPKVPVDLKLLKNVIAAGGGQALLTLPTLRALNSHPGRFVISCPGDSFIWRPLAEQHPIYSQELVLTGTLRQQVDWEANEFKVPGSF